MCVTKRYNRNSKQGKPNHRDEQFFSIPMKEVLYFAESAWIQKVMCKLVCLVLLYDITTKNRRGSQVIAIDMPFFVRKDHQLFFIGKVLVKEDKAPLCVCVSKSL